MALVGTIAAGTGYGNRKALPDYDQVRVRDTVRSRDFLVRHKVRVHRSDVRESVIFHNGVVDGGDDALAIEATASLRDGKELGGWNDSGGEARGGGIEVIGDDEGGPVDREEESDGREAIIGRRVVTNEGKASGIGRGAGVGKESRRGDAR